MFKSRTNKKGKVIYLSKYNSIPFKQPKFSCNESKELKRFLGISPRILFKVSLEIKFSYNGLIHHHQHDEIRTAGESSV